MEILRVKLDRAGYTRGREILRNVSFSLQTGEMMGLIGPNGAGKSTTIKAILGLLKNVEGDVRLLGVNRRYSYIPEHPVLYDELTVWEHLELAASVYGIPRTPFEERALKLLLFSIGWGNASSSQGLFQRDAAKSNVRGGVFVATGSLCDRRTLYRSGSAGDKDVASIACGGAKARGGGFAVHPCAGYGGKNL